ncbi:MAG: 4Fe-4S binding protein, partial [SAR324 cluster bacterium]|nr:4Fe-4S binding protein [SAR324 cluster bacterium]
MNSTEKNALIPQSSGKAATEKVLPIQATLDAVQHSTQTEVGVKKTKKRKGPGLRDVSIHENKSPRKWLIIRWSFLLGMNFLFFASFYYDIQILEGTLSGSRLLGFHLADPFAALQVMLASKVIHINLIIGMTTVVIIYLMLGGRFFCSWVCPYHFLAELGEMLHNFLIRKRLISRNHVFDTKIKYYFYLMFLGLAFFTGFTVFEVLNPVAILSRFIVYGPGLILLWVLALLLFEVFYSRRAWCRYFCPVGVSYNILGRFAPFKVRWNVNKCSNCK